MAIGNANSIRFLDLQLDSLQLLARLYMPAILQGGLFVPSEAALPALNERVFLTLKLTPVGKEYVTLARVIWLHPNPGKTSGPCRRGYGLQFETENEGLSLILEGLLEDDEKNATVAKDSKGSKGSKKATRNIPGEARTVRENHDFIFTF